jgi:hypothetical protein|tara:strand:- start:402 stop:602 length:201 start_codon:yes stop_codon:yes gene_type:complete
MAEMELKEFMFTFEGGGWNTVWAKTRRGAIKEAVRQYKDSDSLNPIESSVHLATKEGLRMAMSSFY